MFILQKHHDIVTNPAYRDCADAKEFLAPVSIAHLNYLKKLTYLATFEDGKPVHVQKLTAVDNTVYLYVDKLTPKLLNELRMVVRPATLTYPGAFFAVCEPEGRDPSMEAVTFGFTVPPELRSIEKLAPLIGHPNAQIILEGIASVSNPQHEYVMNWKGDEEMAEYFQQHGLKFVSAFYAL